MQFSEDDLRTALERKEPGADFTQRVMAQISQAETQAKSTPVRQDRKGLFSGWWKMKPRPALALAMTVVLLTIGVWLGYQQHQRHVLEVQREHERQELAAKQAILALRITSAKLNHVFRKVNGSLPQNEPNDGLSNEGMSNEEKTRRQIL